MKIIQGIGKVVKKFGGVYFFKEFNQLVRKFAAGTHFCQHYLEWGVPPTPEYYDHFLDQYWQWGKLGNPMPWERGIFSLLVVQPEAEILELCCGDGFNAHNFYAIRAKHITCLDFDANAIKWARKNFRSPKIEFVCADIRKGIPKIQYDNIIWDAAIEHFTETEIQEIMANIKSALKPDGILSGYTIVEKDSGQLSLSQHEYEFKSKADLLRFFEPYFKHVKIFETKYPGRHNLYFYATDSVTLPFDEVWDQMLVK